MKSILSGGKINNDQILEWVEADPSLVLFKGTYYLFPSMTAGFFTSNDLVEWETTDAAGSISCGDMRRISFTTAVWYTERPHRRSVPW